MEFFTSANISAILEIVVQIVGVASLVATLTPNENDNKAVDFVLNIVNMLGANVGKASNDPSV
tara:strand:+ start:31 stop:219 length:189 start_codon:yes stop_codon:yes gene_type:complete